MAQRVGIGFASGGGGHAHEIEFKEPPKVTVEWMDGRIVKIKHVGKLLSSDVLKEMRSEIRRLNGRGARAVAFEICAFGADIKEFPPCLGDREVARQSANQMANLWHGLIQDIMAIEMPVAIIDGYALGGGYEIPLACKYIIATKGSRIGLPETTLGILPGGGGTYNLTRRVGIVRSAGMILEGKTIEAARPWVDLVVDGSTDDVIRDFVVSKLVLKERFRDEYRPTETEIWMARMRKFMARLQWGFRPPASLYLAWHAIRKGGLGDGWKAFTNAFMTHDAREGIETYLKNQEIKRQNKDREKEGLLPLPLLKPCFQGI